MSHERKPYGLVLRGTRAAANLEKGEIVVLDGHVVDVKSDSDGDERVRVVLVRALGPPPGRNPDQREIELTCPHDMRFATAEPENIDLPPPQQRL